VFILWFLSLLPLLNLLSNKPFFTNPNDIIHPALAALVSSFNNGAYFSLVGVEPTVVSPGAI
jgi:hypothetical protein